MAVARFIDAPLAIRGPAPQAVTLRVVLQFPVTFRDMEFAGRGIVSGTVKQKGTPDAPVHRKVRLLRDRDALVVRETWSDMVTGNYAFSEIDERYTYTVISYDHTLNYRAVIADRVTPELMV